MFYLYFTSFCTSNDFNILPRISKYRLLNNKTHFTMKWFAYFKSSLLKKNWQSAQKYLLSIKVNLPAFWNIFRPFPSPVSESCVPYVSGTTESKIHSFSQRKTGFNSWRKCALGCLKRIGYDFHCESERVLNIPFFGAKTKHKFHALNSILLYSVIIFVLQKKK